MRVRVSGIGIFHIHPASLYRTRAIGVEQLAEDLVRLLGGGKKVMAIGFFTQIIRGYQVKGHMKEYVT